MSRTPGENLRDLLARQSKVLAVLGPISGQQAKIMEHCGVEAGFVGTGLTFGHITGLADNGVASSTECLMLGGYIARAVAFPVILDGDTGHGGVDAVKRLVGGAIREGLAGIRIDDQPIEVKRATQSEGVAIVDERAAIERYAAACSARDELDPSFLIMAQCYARDAVNGGLDELHRRLSLYEDESGVDWVQFESPHSVDEVRSAREVVKGCFSVMQGKMARPLSLPEHQEIGLQAAWYTFLPSRIVQSASLEFLTDFRDRGIEAWTEYLQDHEETLARFRGIQ